MGSPRQRQRAAAAGVQAAAAAATGAQQQQAKGSTAAGMEKEGRGAVASSSSGWFGWVRWLGAEEGHPKHLGWYVRGNAMELARGWGRATIGLMGG